MLCVPKRSGSSSNSLRGDGNRLRANSQQPEVRMVSRRTRKNKWVPRRDKAQATSRPIAVPVGSLGASLLSAAPSSYATPPRVSGQIK